MVKNKVFVDSSVLIAAVLSSSGGSFYILNLMKDKFEFYINEYVLREVGEVLKKKFPDREGLQNKLFLLIGGSIKKILPNPSSLKKIKYLEKFFSKEDAPILASALEQCDYLLTLDKDFLAPEVLEFSRQRGSTILRPKEFIGLSKKF